MYRHVLYACTFVALVCCPALLVLRLYDSGVTERWLIAFSAWISALWLLKKLWRA